MRTFDGSCTSSRPSIVVWTSEAARPQYSYAEFVAAGDQLRPMFMQGANRIEVYFDVPVVFPSQPQNALSVIGDNHDAIAATIGFDQNSSTSTKGVLSWLGVQVESEGLIL